MATLSIDALRTRFDVASSDVTVAGTDAHIWHPRSAEDLIDEAAFERDERLPYWADIWPSAMVLASQVASIDGASRRLLELGCGVGVAAVAAARVGFDVMATDYYEDALLFTALNVRENAGVLPETRVVDWRDFPTNLGSFDVVVASDVLYERPYASLVARAFAVTLAPDGVGWLADPGRIAAPAFLSAGPSLGLSITRAKRVPFHMGNRVQQIDLYELRRIR